MNIKEKEFNYVYLITNLINGKQYIGDHSTNNLNDYYLGGGIYLNNSKKEHKQKIRNSILKKI